MADKKKMLQRVEEIRTLMAPFAIMYMDEETFGFCLKLLSKLSRKRTIDITRGKPGNWAGGIIYAVGRLNFMFDKAQDYWFTADELATVLKGSKSTFQQKAKSIEDACKLGLVDAELSRRKLSQGFQLVQLPNGLMVPVGTLQDEGEFDDSEDEPTPEETHAKLIFSIAKEAGHLEPPRNIALGKDTLLHAGEKRNTEREQEKVPERQPRLF